MGLPSFPSPADQGVLPMLVMNTVMSVAIVTNKLRSVLQVLGSSDQELIEDEYSGNGSDGTRPRRVSITTRYASLCGSGGGDRNCVGAPRCHAVECCCVCLSRFEADEEVSELSCKHFFHKGCLEKWFDNQHVSCPLCRSNT